VSSWGSNPAMLTHASTASNLMSPAKNSGGGKCGNRSSIVVLVVIVAAAALVVVVVVIVAVVIKSLAVQFVYVWSCMR